MSSSIRSLVETFAGVVRENVEMAPFTSLQLGGTTKYLAEPQDEEQLIAIVRACSEAGVPIRILGGGSNLLIREAGFDGMVIRLISPAFSQLRQSDLDVTCGGGTKLSHLITYCVGAGLAGLEHLVGIPGTVGGALHGNSGTDDGDIGQFVVSARLLRRSGEVVQVKSEELAFSHRRSSLDELVILDATFRLAKDDIRKLTKREQTFWIVKRAKQPNYPARSAVAFIDPDGASAAGLILQSGHSGAIVGAVQMSPLMPNYIVAGPGATSEQVLQLLEKVRVGVQEKTGVRLQAHLEVW